jgi:membrane protease YdiL (CAAX protease family)/uncharacterized RDD family membrane protein YckC
MVSRASTRLASPGRRLLARLVDTAIIGCVGVVAIGLVPDGSDAAVYLAILALFVAATIYEVACTAAGATLGKRMLGIKVVGADGQSSPGWAAAWLRVAALSPFLLGAPVCGIGVLRRYRTGAHDRVAETLVTRPGHGPLSAWLRRPPPDAEAGPRFRVGDVVTTVFVGLWFGVVGGLLAAALEMDSEAAALFGVLAPSQFLGELVTVWALSVRKGTGSFRLDFGLAVRLRDGAYLLLGPVLNVGVGILFLPLFALLETDEPSQEVVRELAEARTPLLMITAGLGVAVVGPLVEELLFRGMLLRLLLRRQPEQRAVIMTTLAFAAVHLLDPGSWPQLPGLAVLGYVLARITLASKSLSPAILTHVGFNLIVVISIFMTSASA